MCLHVIDLFVGVNEEGVVKKRERVVDGGGGRRGYTHLCATRPTSSRMPDTIGFQTRVVTF